ncbi:MAG: hypothetical protein IKD45_01800 [Clostridia bacterium]|nr:hypothetical protein [Clostridia bacterium]
MKKLLILLLALGVIFSLAACNTNTDTPSNENNGNEGGGDNTDECPGHFDNDGDGYCDACDEEYTPEETGLVDYTVSVKTDLGEACVGVKVEFYKNDETAASALTGADGTATLSIVGGTYTVVLTDGMKETWIADAYTAEVSEAKKSLDITVYDNTPDGSEEKPYGVSDTETSYTLAAGGNACFYMRNVSVILTVKGTDIKLTLGEEEYTPNSDGIIELTTETVAEGSTYVTIDFVITNLSEDENSVSVCFSYLPGSSENPIFAPLGETASVQVAKNSTVYYIFRAEKNGMLMLSTSDENANIMLYNLTRGTVTSYNTGKGAICIAALEGDEISIPVASIGAEDVNTVTFTLSFAEEGTSDKLTLGIGTTFVTVAKGKTLTFECGEISEITVSGSNVKVYLNGEEITDSSFTVSAGDTVALENVSDGAEDIEITAILTPDGEASEG